MRYDYVLKIILVGDSNTGKSFFFNKLAERPTDNLSSTVGVDFSIVYQTVYDKEFRINLWDTAGQENFAPIIRSYYRGVAGVLLVFDVGDKRTFDNLNFWLHELETNKDPNHPCPVIVVGHKIDKTHRAVSRDEAEEFAKLKGITYMEASSKTGQNVDDIFHEIVRKILENFNDGFAVGTRLNPLGEAKKRLELVKDDKEHRYNCCCMC